MSNIKTSTAGIVTAAKMTDRSVASACSLGLSGAAFLGSGLPVTGLSGLGTSAIERNERPTKALEAVAAGKATAYAFAATGAGIQQRQTTHHHMMWAFRGLEPWSDPV
ncbi:hypothetical protein AB0B30_16500 [Streptomyces narbonensis]|uniref:Uncharacterized protein n=1 Tax=Streptomyces narbonensis TaxID=67333 RepID=A0ABV3CN39_9ACTN